MLGKKARERRWGQKQPDCKLKQIHSDILRGVFSLLLISKWLSLGSHITFSSLFHFLVSTSFLYLFKMFGLCMQQALRKEILQQLTKVSQCPKTKWKLPWNPAALETPRIENHGMAVHPSLQLKAEQQQKIKPPRRYQYFRMYHLCSTGHPSKQNVGKARSWKRESSKYRGFSREDLVPHYHRPDLRQGWQMAKALCCRSWDPSKRMQEQAVLSLRSADF